MRYIAIINVPGYLPAAGEPAGFEAASDAWAYLADERRDQEDLADGEDYSETTDQLDAFASAGHGEDVIYGSTPGYDGDHDLGFAYSVVKTEGS